MISLYIKTHCPYSAHALAALDIYNVPFVEKNISDPKYEAELMELGGRHKVPFLIDGDVKMYESEAIAEYIAETYGPTLSEDEATKREMLRIHRSEHTDTCSDGLCM